MLNASTEVIGRFSRDGEGLEPGGRLTVSGARGVGAWIWLMGTAGLGAVAPGPRVDYDIMVGVSGAVDVVRWVPSIELLAGFGGTGDQLGFAFAGSMGVERFVARRWSLGVRLQGRGVIRPDDLDPGASVQIRISRRIGF